MTDHTEQPVQTDPNDAVRVAGALHAENARLRAALARSEAERERLREALRPFYKLAFVHVPHWHTRITEQDFERACAALREDRQP